ncbi:MAG TPA: metal-dependent hydrolase [Hyphomicrobiaceae bacterium]|jgi:L-ascorbate metabolism protein UlaG (beta-lactamase superfamily)
MKITWFGHSCFRIETGSSVLLIDPFLKGNPSFEKSGISWEDATSGVTHVALTHGHDDHIGDAGEICKVRDATLFAVFELALHVQGKGAQKLEPMNTGGTVRSTDFDLTFTQALHSSSSNGIYLGNPCGIILKTRENKTVYHMGDTELFSGMEHINELYRPSIGIVPIGDRFTMGARTAAYACKKYFQFSTVIPCHYGTFDLLDQTADAFVSEMAGENVLVPRIGDPISV